MAINDLENINHINPLFFLFFMESPEKKWPVCFSDLVIVGNKDACIGIVTLWTKKELVMQHLQPEQYALLGQLYSRDEGVNGIIRNCLGNKAMRHLVLIGIDLNGSGKVLTSFFEQGIDPETYAVSGASDVFIDKEIPFASLEALRKNVTLHSYQHMKDFSQLPQILNQLQKLPRYGADEFFQPATIAAPAQYPSEQVGFLIQHNFIGSAWLDILSSILRFGTIKKSDYGVDQRELLNVVSVIEKEDPDNPEFYPFFQFTKEELFSYYPQILGSHSLEGVEYSYGQRFSNQKNIDQIQLLIETLQKTQYSRRAIAVTWDIEKDIKSEKPPCLILADFLVQNNQLFLTAFFRSNDMFHAWPRNAFGLRKLQFFVAQKVGIAPASLTIVSSSAHIYQNNWKLATDILQKHVSGSVSAFVGDKRGNIIIRVAERKIIVTHTSPEGKRLEEFSDTDVVRLSKKLLLEKRIGTLSHALYIGTELQKAAVALQKGIPYLQDKELEL